MTNIKRCLQMICAALQLTPYQPGMLNMATAIGYVRVSTSAQGRSGLGLEAQRATIARFAQAEGLDVAGVRGNRNRIWLRCIGAPTAACRSAEGCQQGEGTCFGGEARSAVSRCALHLGIDGASGRVRCLRPGQAVRSVRVAPVRGACR